MEVHLSRFSRFLVVFIPLLAQWPVWSQTTAWQEGIAKVIVRADLYREPGTAFVVAIKDGTAFLVTSAHVVEKDSNPQIEFVAFPRKQYPSRVENQQDSDIYGLHGLALLVVDNPPAGLTVLPPSASRAEQGDSVIVAGYPAPIGEFTVTDTTVGAIRGEDLVLNFETGTGYSGGPILRNGSVVGLVYGAEGRFGFAVPSTVIRTYLEGQGLSWGSQQLSVAESAKAVRPSEPKAGEVRTNPGDGEPYVWIPPGEFQMGCSVGGKCGKDEKPSHSVKISRGFWLGQTEVTQAAFHKVTGANPSHFIGPDNPVERVTWDEARSYCEAFGGRLPTEAEWEYAARAGSQEPRYGQLTDIAWCHSNSGGQTHPVGQKQENAWGLHDMLGNVYEWVSDWYRDDYYKTLPSPAVDPKGPKTPYDAYPWKVSRGGSQWLGDSWVTVSGRFPADPKS